MDEDRKQHSATPDFISSGLAYANTSYLFNNSPKLYVALRGLYQVSLYFKNRTCKGVVRDGFGIAAVEVEIFVAA